MNKKMDKKTIKKGLLPYLFIFVIMLGVFYFYTVAGQKVNDLTYDKFIEKLNKEEITELTIVTRGSGYVYDVSGKLEGYKKNESFESTLPLSDEVMKKIVKASDNQDFKLTVVPDPDSSSLLYILVNILPIVLLVGVAFWFFNKQMASNKGSLDFGKSRARLNSDTNKVTFKDVAGLSEEKEEVKELIDFLKAPKKFQKLGARIPKGVLLMGPPGTGKTLLAKAVAGEAKVPFFSISGSEFVEMFVGMGAAKVRDLFKQAQEKAPCIVFIDEIDTIGKKRDGGGMGGNDEREQTLNQLLTEMDGFDGKKGVVILAATNRPESLDKALLRPGRFDRRVPVELPDLKGREDILKVHAKKVKMDEDVDFNGIARATAGASGAELANIVNEAALRAVRLGRHKATQADLEESVEVIIAGYQRKAAVISPREKKIVAYHEIGHALVAAKQTESAPVHKITIIPRTSGALGYTMQVEEGERVLMSKEEAFNKIATFTGGRAAEEIIFNSFTTGASNDIEQATRIARAMVTRYGMSEEFDMMALETVTNQYLGGDTSLMCSPEASAKIDKEVLNIIKSAHDKARKILEENIDKLHELSEFLLEKETITGEEFMEILNGKSVDEVKEEHDAKEEAKKEAERIEVQKAQEEEKRAIEQQKRIEDELQKNEGNILLDKTIDNEEK